MASGIAMISSVFYPSIGGAQRVVRDVSRGLRERGVDVMVITRHYRGLPHYEEVDGIPTYRVGRGESSKAIAALTYIFGALWLLIKLRHRYSIIHCHQMISPMTIGFMAKLLLRRPLLVMPHGGGNFGDIGVLTQRRPVTGKLRLAMARRWVDAFVCISAAIHDELRRVNMPAFKLHDITNGVDVAHITPVDEARRAELRSVLKLPSGPLVIYTGRLSTEKGVAVLVDAWPLVLQRVPDARLLIVGDGDERAPLTAQAQRLGINEQVIFAGTTDDVTPFLQAADAFVLPSFSEGMPVSLLEAMSCGLPSVGTAVVGTVQVIDDGRNGRLVPAGDPPALAEGLVEALTVPAAHQWGVEARQHVVQHYGLDAVLTNYIALYTSILHGRSGEQFAPDPAQRIGS